MSKKTRDGNAAIPDGDPHRIQNKQEGNDIDSDKLILPKIYTFSNRLLCFSLIVGNIIFFYFMMYHFIILPTIYIIKTAQTAL